MPDHEPGGTGRPQSSLVTYPLVLSIVSAGVIGLVMTGLLPALSGCRVGLGTAVLASFVGQMVPFNRRRAHRVYGGVVLGRRRFGTRPAVRPLRPRAPVEPGRRPSADRDARTLPA